MEETKWQTEERDWEPVKSYFPIGKQVEAIVTSREVFGIFLDLGHGVVGLVEAPEIPGGKARHHDDFPQVAEKVSCRVLGQDERNRQVVLTMLTETDLES